MSGELHVIEELKEIALDVRKDIVRLASIKTIHIGGDLSVVDILTVLWQAIIKYDANNPQWEGRDRFFLSKGHCSAVVAFNQAYRGFFSKEDIFKEYATDNGRFSMSPCCHVNPYYESSATGSLGQGLPIAVGVAKALKMKNNFNNKVYVVIGDGELQEGSNWEAIMLAGQLQLDNLIVLVDNNKLQFDGKTDKIVSVQNISKRFESFGWLGYEVNGHNIAEIYEVLLKVQESKRPVVIDAHTIKGKGVEYMENNYIWHAGRISENDLERTLAELSRRYE